MMFFLLPLVDTARTPLLFSEDVESLVLLGILRIFLGSSRAASTLLVPDSSYIYTFMQEGL